MKKYFLVFSFLAAFVGTSHASADFDITKWPYQKTIPRVESRGVYTKVNLGDEISGEYGFRDLRIIDTKGNEVPYVLNEPQSTSNYQKKTATIKNLVTTSDGKTVFVVDVGTPDEAIYRLHIDTPAQTFHRPVSVFVSETFLPNESSAWQKVPKDNIIFRITNGADGVRAEYTDIAVAGYVVRYVKVVIDAGLEGPIVPASVSAFFHADSNPSASYIDPIKTSLKEVPQNKTTEIYTEFKAPLFVSGIFIPTTNTTYSRSVVIQGKVHEGDAWRAIGSGLFSDTSGEAILFPETLVQFVRVVIFNGDDAPLRIPLSGGFNEEITFLAPVKMLVFKENISGDHTLYFGNKKAEAPQYELSRIIPKEVLRGVDTNTVLLTVGANPKYIAEVSNIPFSDRYPLVLSIALIFGVLVIGGIIFQTARKKFY